MKMIILKRFSLYFLCLAFGSLAVVAPYASNGTVVLLGVGVLAVFGNLSHGFQYFRRALSSPSGVALVLLLAWIALSLSWSIVDVSAAAGPAFAVIFLCIIGILFMGAIEELDTRPARIAQTVLIISCVAMIGIFLFEWVTQGVVAKFLKGITTSKMDFVGRGLAILICIIWPVAALIEKYYGKAIWVVAFFITIGATTYPYPNEAMFLGFVIGLFTFAACLWFRRTAVSLIFGTFTILVLAGPIIAKTIMDVPAVKAQAIEILGYRQHRINIWRFVASLIEERPIIGHGFEASRPIGAEENRYYLETKEILGGSRFRIRLPLHPHNNPMQIWLELGFVGILFYLGILFGIVRIIWTWRGPPIWSAALGASMASYLTVSSLSFGVWQNWWIATAWLTAGALVLSRRAFDES